VFADPVPCCTPAEAWAWVEALAEEALAGDDGARRALAIAVAHYLARLEAVVA
jgi:hypothetical protein